MARIEDRYSALRVAHLSSQAIDRHPVTVRNISKSGASIRTKQARPKIGETVSIDFGSGDVKQGCVRWNVDDKLGIHFL